MRRRVDLVVPLLKRQPRECRDHKMNDDEKAMDCTYKRDCAKTSQRSLRVTGDGSSAGWAASAIYQDIAKDTTFGSLKQPFCSLLIHT